VKLRELLLDAKVYVAVLVEAFLNDLSPILAAFADGLHLELHLIHWLAR